MAETTKTLTLEEAPNPNEGVNGALASNVTGEALKSVFDYGSITDRDKEVVNEVIELLKNREGVPSSMIIEELMQKWNIEEIPMKSVMDTVWGQLTKGEKIGMSQQGYRLSTDENGKKIKIPHIGFSADLDYLDGFVNRLVKKAQEIK